MSAGLAGATAFVVLVPEAESLVGALRSSFDPSAAAGVPAHVTVLYPFMSAEQVTDEVLARAAEVVSGIEAFDYRLARVQRFPGALYLAPRPASAFIALTVALVRAFPTFPPFGGVHDRIVPHLTVAQGDDATLQPAEAELRAALRAQGPIAARCHRLCLLENAEGRWRERHALALHGEEQAPAQANRAS